MESVVNILLLFEQSISLAFLFMLSCNLDNSQVNFIFLWILQLQPQSACKEVRLVLDVKEE